MHAAFGFEGLRPYQAGRSRTRLKIKKQDVSSDVPADVRFRDLDAREACTRSKGFCVRGRSTRLKGHHGISNPPYALVSEQVPSGWGWLNPWLAFAH